MTTARPQTPPLDPAARLSAQLRIRLDEIDAEMAELQTKLTLLAAERKTIFDAVEHTVYPVLTLPPEITAEFFIRYVYVEKPTIEVEGVGEDGIIVEVTGGSPLVLASVCRAWREIALDLPALWSRFSIVAGFDTHGNLVAQFLRHCWLPRVGAHPMEVDIRIGYDQDSEDYGAIADPVVAALAQYCTQWQTLDIDRHSLPLLTAIQGNIPLLRKLSVSAYTPPELPVMAFSDAPLLREVCLFETSGEWIFLPWAQLTSLEFDFLRNSIDILRQTPQLETLCINTSFLPLDAPPAPVQLDHLHTFMIRRNRKANLDVLHSLIFPSLRVLDFEYFFEELLPTFAAFLVRSGCALQTISFDHTPYDIVTKALGLVPTVKEANILATNWKGSDLMSFFRLDLEGVLPNLNHLSVKSKDSFPYQDMLRMLEQRYYPKDGFQRLDSFQLVLGSPPGLYEDFCGDATLVEWAQDRIRLLVAAGCHIDIQSPQRLSTSSATYF